MRRCIACGHESEFKRCKPCYKRHMDNNRASKPFAFRKIKELKKMLEN